MAAAAPWPATYDQLFRGTQVARDERKEAREALEKHLHGIVARLEGFNQGHLLRTGSAFEGLKVARPNEADFMLLDISEPIPRLPAAQEIAFLPLDCPPEKFRQDFAAAVKATNPSCKTSVQGPGVKLSYTDHGVSFTADLIPAIRVRVDKIPFAWSHRWLPIPERERELYAVAKVDPVTRKWGWRLSFSVMELNYIKHLTNDKKMCLRFVKYLSEGRRPGKLKSYMLKNAWLDFLALHPDDVDWSDDKISQLLRTKKFLDHTINLFQKKFLPIFFAPTVNLLAHMRDDDNLKSIEHLCELKRKLEDL
eukprot:m.40531 g.40531  ORF g.40531 m.40531 type:complete len:308 (-) comp14123_c0_seq2:143-1066(-)